MFVPNEDSPRDFKELMEDEFGVETQVEKEEVKKLIDTSNFKPITCDELTKILGLTIKRDETNKIITFLAQLSAFTEDSQLNISFNAPSSTGKSFIPLEIVKLFPDEDVIKLGNCSPTAFYHEQGEYDKATNTIKVDLSRKIIIFLDQPNIQLLERTRSLLSHDEKIIKAKITDKNQKGGNRTKTVAIKGFPAVIFCTAGLRLDEQEATRFLLLSPEINNEKIREAIFEKIKKEADSKGYKEITERDPDRKLLKDRILAIKEANIQEIKIGNSKLVEEEFFKGIKQTKPRHQRDIARVISLIKVLALLNLWFREKDGDAIVANDDDIKEAFKIWISISESQELNLPPYVLNLYKDVILGAYSAVKRGLSRQEIMKKHFEVYGRFLPDWQLRQWIIPMLETSGLITQEADSFDKRKILISPTSEINSESDGGVDAFLLAQEVFSENKT
ncbi:MAG: hypothetical protein ACD_13C00134G0041 [uncultured bacterium]|uniref:DUF3987 domain-containing protein n=1 Tax=Candidatus Woesebacteria bacterium GW2011_GWA1_40_43 TaxID=1618553 RepID=A0A0G0UWI9_9BACT|nr:MAG: hypothetical protein ACD_13C00134G0041 [uncultured bacterium]KKR52179.1 MAG: hypothetical protein UT88_C0024G0014 [Candidatus Woesebacteria bacterium GW2011_GWD2_40_19]KKR57624.1 MAG: hypothetical protein UT96_C0016G0009 [Candidatus Woesebacteria bacterium GW2011_GWC2_40_30]KKR64045.1 MAG: hypothetical protein UU02_C0013G0003 [Candidatus Woesebacteria bacterium GW2011_GWA1_40_43]HAU65457.1 hypothetical protein [Candidatus Woesebacteria bacterium]